MFKKAFWVPYEDCADYPTVTKAKDAISRYCAENGWSYSFPAEDAVIIEGKEYEVYRGYESWEGEITASNARKNKAAQRLTGW